MRVAASRSRNGFTYFCDGHNANGEPCGNKVSTSRGLCWIHRRKAEQKYREARAAQVTREQDEGE